MVSSVEETSLGSHCFLFLSSPPHPSFSCRSCSRTQPNTKRDARVSWVLQECLPLSPPCTRTATAQPYGFQAQPNPRSVCQLLLNLGQSSTDLAGHRSSCLQSHAYPPFKHSSSAVHKSQVVVEGKKKSFLTCRWLSPPPVISQPALRAPGRFSFISCQVEYGSQVKGLLLSRGYRSHEIMLQPRLEGNQQDIWALFALFTQPLTARLQTGVIHLGLMLFQVSQIRKRGIIPSCPTAPEGILSVSVRWQSCKVLALP